MAVNTYLINYGTTSFTQAAPHYYYYPNATDSCIQSHLPLTLYADPLQAIPTETDEDEVSEVTLNEKGIF